MKKRICALLLAGLLLLTATGCGSPFEDEYYYEAPITGDFGTFSGNAREIRNYSMLKTALTDLISRHEQQGEFRLNNYNGSPSEDLAAACFEIKSDNPLGAYAVENISYDTSYVVSYYMANIYISYKRTAEEIEGITYAGSIAELDSCILQTMEEMGSGAVVRLYSAVMDETHIRRLVKRRYYEDPVSLILEPEVEVTTYPLEGANRIYDVRLDYGVTQSANRAMSLALAGQLRAAELAMQETQPLYLALESAVYLSELCINEPSENVRPGTAYGAMVEHYADGCGMALAYKALCDRLGIPCMVVEGTVRNMGMEPHFWNIVTLDDASYHVDVSALAADPAGAFLLDDDTLWGAYIWETEDYPACNGTLTYADAARLEPETEPEPGQTPEDPEDVPQDPTESDEPPAEPEEDPSEELPPEENEKST